MSAMAEIAVGKKARVLRMALSTGVLASCEVISCEVIEYSPATTGCVPSSRQKYRERCGYETAVTTYSCAIRYCL
jgi:hypothetical protein